MIHKIFVLVVIQSLLLSGCYTWEIVKTPDPGSKIKITTRDFKEIELSHWTEKDDYFAYYSSRTDTMQKDTLKGGVKFYKKDILAIKEKKFDTLRTTIVLVSSITIVVYIVALIAFQNWDNM